MVKMISDFADKVFGALMRSADPNAGSVQATGQEGTRPRRPRTASPSEAMVVSHVELDTQRPAA